MLSSVAGVLRLVALGGALIALGCVLAGRLPWGRWALVAGAVCLLAAPWWSREDTWCTAPGWQGILAYAVVFAALWRCAQQESRRAVLGGLAAGLALGALLGLLLPGRGGTSPRLLTLAAGLMLPAATGVLLGALAGHSSEWTPACRLTLGVQSASLLAMIVTQQELAGSIWDWDPLLCAWMVGLLAVLCGWLIGERDWGRRVWVRSGLLLILAAACYAQAALTAPLIAWLGYATSCLPR